MDSLFGWWYYNFVCRTLILIYTKSIATTSLIPGGGVIIAGVIGFFVWKYLENDAKKNIRKQYRNN